MKDSKQLYKELSKDFETEKYYTFAKRGEGMLQTRENNGKRIFLVNTEKKEAWELVGETGAFSLWNASAVELSSVFGLTELAQRNAMSVKVPYYFGIEDYENGITLVMWTLQPDGRYYADSDGYGMTNDEEINLYAYIDKEGYILVPFQPMDKELKKSYLSMAERIAANRETVPYVCLNPELTIPFEENHNLKHHKDVLFKVFYGMMLKLSAMVAAKEDDREYNGELSVLTAINPGPDKHLDYALYANETGEHTDKYELMGLSLLYENSNEPIGCKTPFGVLSSLEISEIMTNKESIQLLFNDFVESAEMILSGNLPQSEI